MIDPGRRGGRGRGEGFDAEPGTAQTTGRYVVAFTETDPDPARLLRSVAGVSTVADSRDFEDQSVDMSETARAEAGARFEDDDEATWGLQATRATTSSLSGRGVKVVVLDTGIDGTHPDFAGRAVTA